MTIFKLLDLVENGNTAAFLFGQKKRGLHIELKGLECGYFTKKIEFELYLTDEYRHEFVIDLLTSSVYPSAINKDQVSICSKEGKNLGHAEMYEED